MVRVFRRPASTSTRRAPSRVAKRKAQKHRVVMESVTQEKKKLRSVISFESKAPPGYTFISAGSPQVTNACKELCRKDGLKIFAVTTTPHAHTHNLSQHVHRIGFHFPSAVVATVCMDLGLYLTAAGKVVSSHGIGGHIESNNADQITINTEARDALRDLFPNIPDNDLNQIIKTAFQKGQRKVGTAFELPLVRRAQLAVVAHIRHVYTDYDRLLKVASFHEARSQVEEPTLARLVEWRGDDENGKTVLEDVFREVIVISDDDGDSDFDEAEDAPPSANKDHGVEYVSSRTRAVELPTRPATHENQTSQRRLRDLSEGDTFPGFRIIPQAPKKSKIDRRGFSRYQAWDRAINRYRNLNHGADQDRPYGGPAEHQRPFFVRQPLREPIEAVTEEPRHKVVPPCPVPVAPPSNSLRERQPYELYHAPEFFRERNPRVVQLFQPWSLKRTPVVRDEYSFRQHGLSDAPVLLNDSQGARDGIESLVEQPSRVLASSHNRISNTQDRVLPSIENPRSSQEIKRPGSGRLGRLPQMMTGGLSIRSVTPQRFPYPEIVQQDICNHANDERPPKRRWVDHGGRAHGNFHPSVAHGAVESVSSVINDIATGGRYIPSGQSSAQDDPLLRRKCVAPVEPPFTGLWPQRSQGFSVDPYVNPSSDVLVDPRRIDDRGANAAHHHIPGLQTEFPKQYYMWPSAPGCVTTVDGSFESSAPPIYYGDQNYKRPLELQQPHFGPWRSEDNEKLVSSQDVSQRRRLYADDFVRPVGFNEPEPPEYRPRVQTRRIAEAVHPTRVRVSDGQRDETANTRALDSHGHPHAVLPSREYASLNNNRAMAAGRFEPFLPAHPRHYEQRYEGPLDSARPECDHRYMPQAHNLEHPDFVRRVGQQETFHPVSDNRHVVIVD